MRERKKVFWCSGRDSNPGRRLESSSSKGKPSALSYNRLEFIEYPRVNGYYETTIKDVVSYLDKYSVDVSGPKDVIHLFSKVETAKRHVILAFRLLLNYYETLGYNSNYLDVLRKAIPRVRCGVDLKIPSKKKIVNSLTKLETSPKKYKALYNLLLDSGLRLVESVASINNFKDVEEVNGFFRCHLGDFRGTKRAYYCHFSESTYELISNLDKKLNVNTSSHYFYKMKFVTAKYLRKFCFDKMIEPEVPESVADFIQGRVPRRVEAKHYMALARQARKFYPRYMGYVEKLRNTSIFNRYQGSPNSQCSTLRM